MKKIDLWKMKGRLRIRGDHAWPNEGAAVTEAADLKVLFIKVYLQLCSNLDAGVRCYLL